MSFESDFVVNNQLKFELHIAPNNSTKSIKLKYEGLDKVQIIEKERYFKLGIMAVGLEQFKMLSKHDSLTGVIGFCCCYV